MYRFQIGARTQPGETIHLVGSTPELGQWDANQGIPLHTSRDRYPLWWVDLEIGVAPSSPSSHPQTVEYKYVLLDAEGNVQWEAWGTNRWIPIERDRPPSPIVVDDGWFGYIQPWPYGYLQQPITPTPLAQSPDGLKIAIVGSSVALGCSAWLLKGWAWHLERALNQTYGHQLVNLSELGANVSTTIARFERVVTPEQPDVVIIALSPGNEGLAYSRPHERRAVQRRFESGLQQLAKMIRELGALPILGGVYPHGDYSPEQTWLLRDTHQRMLSWDIPILDWLAVVDDGEGRWKAGTSFDAAHPNTEGHRLMFEAIDQSLFQIDKAELAQAKKRPQQTKEIAIYRDNWGFRVLAHPNEKRLRVINTSKSSYTISPDWQELQTTLQSQAKLMPGIYIAKNAPSGTLPFLSVREDGAIETIADIPPAADLEYSPAFDLFSPKVSEILFYDGHLGILKESDRCLRVINETDREYNIHPMWQEVRSALKAMLPGVYEEPLHPNAPFRTMLVGSDGLESRVKAPPKSSILFQYQCRLSDISRIAILPLGDRCAVRMLLYKMEYDGPAFPFDLTRTTKLADVADIIAKDFQDLWNPAFLHYNPDEKRIYHAKWSGLSFAHEVEETDDPLNDMYPVHERMRLRYTARSQRFQYAVRQCDEVLFVRTGTTDRGQVSDLIDKLTEKCKGKPFRILLISPQPSDEFLGLPEVLHYDLEFNPDRMYADLEHWMYCTEVMRGILASLGISSKNLFWCPPNPPKDVSFP
jgi:lysophospholipase L1-like esterase